MKAKYNEWWLLLQMLHRFSCLITEEVQNTILYGIDCTGFSVFRMAIFDLSGQGTCNHTDFVLRCVVDETHAFSVHSVQSGVAYLAYRYLEKPDGFACEIERFLPELVVRRRQFAHTVTRSLISSLMRLYQHYNSANVLHLVCQLYASYNNYTIPHHDIQLLISIWKMDPILLICHSAFFLLYTHNRVYKDTEQLCIINQLLEESCSAIERVQDLHIFMLLHNTFKSNVRRLNVLLSAAYDTECRTELLYAKLNNSS